ncbi:MAG: cold-shock protein [Bacteroidales bacterium]
METGIILKIIKGSFGFIKTNDGDIYFKCANIIDNERLNSNDKVSFERIPSIKKPNAFEAINITLLEKAIERSEIKINNDVQQWSNFGKIRMLDKGKLFGFVNISYGQDVYFHRNNFINAIDFFRLKENDYLLFNIIPSKKQNDKTNAINIVPINEIDIHKLFGFFNSNPKRFQEEIIKNLSDKQRLELFKLQFSVIQTIDCDEKYQLLYKLLEDNYEEKYSNNNILTTEIRKYIYDNSNEYYRNKLIIETSFGFSIDLNLDKYFINFHLLPLEIQIKHIKRLSDIQQFEIFKLEFEVIGKVDKIEKYNQLIAILNKGYVKVKSASNINNYVLNCDYINTYGFVQYYLSEFIKEYIYQNSNELYQTILSIKGLCIDIDFSQIVSNFHLLTLDIQNLFLKKANEDQIFEIFKLQFSKIGEINNEENYNKLLQIIDCSYCYKNMNNKGYLSDKIKDYIYQNSNEYYQILLYYKRYSKNVEFDKYIKYYQLLPVEIQKNIIENAGIDQCLEIFKSEFAYLGKIDNEEKYINLLKLIKSIYFNKDSNYHNKNLLNLICQNTSELYQIKLAFIGYKIELNFQQYFANFHLLPFEIQIDILKKANKDQQFEIFKLQFSILGIIDSEVKYEQFLSVYKRFYINNSFIYNIWSNVQNYLMEYTNKKFLNKIIFMHFSGIDLQSKLVELKKSKYELYSIRAIYDRSLNVIKIIDCDEEYNDFIFRHNEFNIILMDYLKLNFLKINAIEKRFNDINNNIYKPKIIELSKKASKEYQLKMITDGYIDELDSNLLDNYLSMIIEYNGCSDNIFEKLQDCFSVIGSLNSNFSFLKIKPVLNFAKKQLNIDEYDLLIQKLYEDKSNYCKLKLYANDFIKLSDEKATTDFYEIFRKEWFRLLNFEKKTFEEKARFQLPNLKFQFVHNLSKSNKESNNDITFFYKVHYKDIYFGNEMFRFLIDQTEVENIYCNWREWVFSRFNFNQLQFYFSKSQQNKFLRIQLDESNNVISTPELIDDLQELEKTILVIIMQQKRSGEIRNIVEEKDIREVENKIVKLSIKDIKRITEEENSECVTYLLGNIKESNTPIYINEILSESNFNFVNKFSTLGSWLFTFSVSLDQTALVWESVKLDRATHLFKIQNEDLPRVSKLVEEYLSQPSFNKRKRLHSSEGEDIELKNNLLYWCCVEHDWLENCNGWYKKMTQLIPSLNFPHR